MEAPHILNQKPRLSISSQNTPDPNSLFVLKLLRNNFSSDKTMEGERGREGEREGRDRKSHRVKQNNLLDL